MLSLSTFLFLQHPSGLSILPSILNPTVFYSLLILPYPYYAFSVGRIGQAYTLRKNDGPFEIVVYKHNDNLAFLTPSLIDWEYLMGQVWQNYVSMYGNWQALIFLILKQQYEFIFAFYSRIDDVFV